MEEMFMREEAARCMLCYEAPCSAACPKGLAPDRFIRSLNFSNGEGATVHVQGCIDCGACERACIKPARHVEIRSLIRAAQKKYPATCTPKADLSAHMCGVNCINPFFLSSSVVASGYEMCASALQQGWAGVVYKTYATFVPEELSPRFSQSGKESTPFVGFRNAEQISDKPLAYNLSVLSRLKADFPDRVIVGSIMGRTEEEWTYLAQESENAGCDVIECNFSCPHMSDGGLGSDVGTHPELVEKFTRAVRAGTKLPVLAKMTPNITNMEPAAEAALRGGADGIAAINTIKSITDVDDDTLVAQPSICGKSTVSGYSGKAVKPIALRFIHDLKKNAATAAAPLSGIGGIETYKDALDFLLLGCENVQITTAVMQYGYRIIDDLKDGLSRYLSSRGKRLCDITGSALKNFVPADELERSTICYPSFGKECIGCGRCFISCEDGGHQAIVWDETSRRPRLDGKACAGCGLCNLVCPTGAAKLGKRVGKVRAQKQ